jgi:hypothetical protein
MGLKWTTVFVVMGLLWSGCRQWTPQTRSWPFRPTRELDSYIGQYEQDIVMGLGAPEEVQDLPQVRILHYHKDFPFQTYINPPGLCSVGDTAKKGPVREYVDDYKFYVRNGVAVKWDGYVQR